MAVAYVGSQKTNPRFGLLTLAAGETKPLAEAVWQAGAAPKGCRGITIQVRSGSVRYVEKSDATDGWTLVGSFGDDAAAGLDGWFIREATGSAAAEVEIICRTGGVS